ncbi:uncharacterized protein E0L32_004485 [Thyridium curvatum]|uniref:ATP-dependent RNA helicase ROK1 n=1 Tax=Thyridium curvatum TaxID=1093900 RepID=A0A507AXJ2_9PEZI|nr:uncharacterized protein E0L32_004485 [Thyridium curvatum]TPX15505.1 hypothetical protein E0L32_004485 [Thyridium curvatum]
MDILKILSRGTKRPAKRAGGASNAQSNLLPSAGSLPHAQLFHDDVGLSRGTKRRRTGNAETKPDEAEEEELSDIDFFAPKDHAKAQDSAKTSKSSKTADQKAKARKAELLDEDECRQLLRSHRLKLTLMKSPSSQEAKEKDKVKKSKKKKKAAKVDAKDDKKQLYPQPLTSFSALRDTYAISSRLAENLEKLSYKEPTEVQMASLPLLLDHNLALGKVEDPDIVSGFEDGADFMAVAPTGSGKTLSFLIPAINGIMKKRAGREDRKQHELNAIVIAPTRELASQIANEGKKLAMGTGLRIVYMRKGMRVAAETANSDKDGEAADDDEISDEGSSSEDEDDEGEDKPKPPKKTASASTPITKADILVTTPMLLLNYLTEGGSSPKTLPNVQSLVLDEADVLLDPLFRDQTVGIWSACTDPDLQVSFWSATMPSNIETLIMAQSAAHAAARGLPSARPTVRLVVGLKDTAVPNVSHRLVYTASEPGKLLALRQLLRPASSSSASDVPLRPPFLVFTQTIERAAALHEELKFDIPLAAGGPARIAVLHSGLPDARRSAVVRRFRAGEVWVLITTDVLARGVDFAGVNGVVSYDVPGSAAAYVHRAGRTGRAGREGGVAVTFYTRDDIPFVKSVANVIALSERQRSAAGGGGGGGGGESKESSSGVQQWLLDALPQVSKEDRKKLRERGVESRRSGAGGKARITSKSAWERRRENNRKGAIEGSKRRKGAEEGGEQGDGGESSGAEWGGLDD